MLFIFDILSAQYYFDPYYVRPRSSRHGSSALGSQGYIVDYPSYDELLKAYIQSYTQNMQSGIKRLNTEPQTTGVTPINGALLLNTSDCAVPARSGNLAVNRFYNSKIWYADSHEIAAGKKII